MALQAAAWLQRHSIRAYVEPATVQPLQQAAAAAAISAAPAAAEECSPAASECTQSSPGLMLRGSSTDTLSDMDTEAPSRSNSQLLPASVVEHRLAATSASGTSTPVYSWPCTTAAPAAARSGSGGSSSSAAHAIPDDVAAQIDFVVVLGGDGTVLWTVHCFGDRPVPPLVPFNMGSLGFLTPFGPDSMEPVLRHVLGGGFPMVLRHRMHCSIIW
jgi:hypothetical protein